MWIFLLIIFVIFLSFGREVLYIASASSMRYVLEEVAREFSVKENIDIRISWEASGNLYAKILKGAPYDVFISANYEYIKNLLNKEFGIHHFHIAKGKLAIVSLRDIDCENLERFLTVVERVAIANPKYAPYGISALNFLKKVGIYESIKEKIVFGTNVSQAFGFVLSGSVEAGIVSYHIAVNTNVNICPLKVELYKPIMHTVIVLKKGWGEKFAEFLKSKKAKEIFSKYGLEVSN